MFAFRDLSAVAKFVAFALVAGVLAANSLATVAAHGGFPRLTLVWPQAQADGHAATQVVTTWRSVGVDGVTTSTIRSTKGATGAAPAKPALSPCGEGEN